MLCCIISLPKPTDSNTAPTKSGLFLCSKFKNASERQMKKLQHKRFIIVPGGNMICAGTASLRYSYAPAGTGLTTMESINKNDKRRPWFKR